MENLQKDHQNVFLNKIFETIENGSGSVSYNNFDLPITNPPLDQLINYLIKRQLQTEETQNAVINQVAELSLKIDDLKEDVSNFSNTYLENAQLKKQVKNINIINTFSKFEKNWNDNGAEPFSDIIIKRALNIINSPSLKFQPDVFPTGRKSIQFEYEKSNGNYLEIEIFVDKYSAYSEINNEEKEYESISFEDILGLVNEFYSRF